MRKIVFALAVALPMSWSFASFAEEALRAAESKAPAKAEAPAAAAPAAEAKAAPAEPQAAPVVKTETVATPAAVDQAPAAASTRPLKTIPPLAKGEKKGTSKAPARTESKAQTPAEPAPAR